MKKNRQKKILIIGLLIFILVLLFSYFLRKRNGQYEIVSVRRGDIKEEIEVSGRVRAWDEVDLAFERGGKVKEILVKIGDEVEKDQLLAVLDFSEEASQLARAKAILESAKSQLAQAEASLKAEKAKLNQLKRGTREEEIKLAEVKVENAQKSLVEARENLEKVKKVNKSDLEKAEQTLADASRAWQTAQEKAETSLANVYADVPDVLNNAYVKSVDAVNSQTDEMFSSDFTAHPQLTFITSDIQAEIDAENLRVQANQAIDDFQKMLEDLNSEDYSSLDNALDKGFTYLKTIRSFLNALNKAVDRAIGLSQTTIDTYKSQINTAQTNIETAISSLNSQKQTISQQKITNQVNLDTAQTTLNSAEKSLELTKVSNENKLNSAEDKVKEAENALKLAQAELNLKKAGYTSEEITAQEARVKEAEANLSSQQSRVKQAEADVAYYSSLIKAKKIIAPFSGKVIKKNIEKGEIVSPNEPVISLISSFPYKVEANISEMDIAKVKIGQSAEITLDAYGEKVIFKAKVFSIDPAETLIEGVATYKTTFEFLEKDERIKPGMSADITILTSHHKNVLLLPRRAVITKDGNEWVKLWQNGKVKERKVKTGIFDTQGNIEIISGLKEGEKVIISSKVKD